MEGINIYAVITGDITNFTTLDSGKREQLIAETETLLRKMVDKSKDAQIFRGDSYQLILKNIRQALTISIRLICWFKLNSGKEDPALQGSRSNHRSGLGSRLSIGIGEIDYRGKSVLESDGQAFHLSGRAFDDMDKGDIVRLTTFDEERNNTYQIILMYINMIIRQWTVSQAETIYTLLSMEEGTQEKIAKRLKMTQPAIANSLRAARWKEVERGINFINTELEKQYLL